MKVLAIIIISGLALLLVNLSYYRVRYEQERLDNDSLKAVIQDMTLDTIMERYSNDAAFRIKVKTVYNLTDGQMVQLVNQNSK